MADIYNQFGERGLKQGIPNKFAGYCFRGNTFEVFKNFFGNENPYEESTEVEPDDHSNDLTVELRVTLKELFTGCFKTVIYR